MGAALYPNASLSSRPEGFRGPRVQAGRTSSLEGHPAGGLTARFYWAIYCQAWPRLFSPGEQRTRFLKHPHPQGLGAHCPG